MSKTGRRQKKPEDKSKADFFMWTDDEVELLLKVTNEYKDPKTMENIDWESSQNKYTDILEAYKDQYPSTAEDAQELGKEYPHKMEELTKAILTTKLKSIRLKYRHAVDSGRRSGHGRVVLLYLELCDQIWGGSPATTIMPSGIETTEIDEGTNSHSSDQPDQSRNSPSSTSVSTFDPDSPDGLDQSMDEGSTLPAKVVKERRDLLSSKLAGYKKEKLKRKLPKDSLLLNCAQEELKIKKQLLERMESTDREYSNNMSKLTSNIEKLTNSISDGFALLRQVMIQPSHAGPAHYLPQTQASSYPTYSHVNPTQMPAALSNMMPDLQNTGQFSYTQSLFSDDRDNNECLQ